MKPGLLLLLTTLLIAACGGDATAGVGMDGRKVVNARTVSSSQTQGLAIDCSFDGFQGRVTCTASGYTDGARLYWWTDEEKAEAEGETFEFAVENPSPDLIISFEECNEGSCQTVTTTLDTALKPSESADTSPATSKPLTTAPPTPTAQADASERSAAEFVRDWSNAGSTSPRCVGSGSKILSTYPVSLDNLSFIHPLGALNSNHITPTSHTMIVPKIDIVADIRAPMDGFIVKVQQRGSAEGLRYIIEITCDFYVILDHVVNPPDWILSVVADNLADTTRDFFFARIPVSEGDVLGRHPDGRYFDLTVVDLSRDENYYVRNESYWSMKTGEPTGEASKLFERDQFEYYGEPLRSALINKSLRTVAPRGGTFTYDIDGTAQGNWFREGTWFLSPNWSAVNHLALVTDPIDPSQLRLSVGDGFKDDPQGTQWGITGDEPRFSEVTVDSGPVAFELRKVGRCDRSKPADSRLPEFHVLCSKESVGTLLIQLLEDQVLRVEVFFDVSPESGPAFSENARTYVR